jgi:hypothetical protein
MPNIRALLVACLFAALLFTSTAALAQAPRSPSEEPSRRVQAFFDRLKPGSAADAYALLFEGTTMLRDKPSEVAILARQTDQALTQYGASEGYELVKEEVASPSALRQVYLQKTSSVPLIWYFYFYRKQGSWLMIQVFFNDRFSDLFSGPTGRIDSSPPSAPAALVTAQIP